MLGQTVTTLRPAGEDRLDVLFRLQRHHASIVPRRVRLRLLKAERHLRPLTTRHLYHPL